MPPVCPVEDVNNALRVEWISSNILLSGFAKIINLFFDPSDLM